MMQTATATRSVSLTRRERSILALVARGLTNQEIADALHLSMLTVKCILHRACVKLKVRTRNQAVLCALRQGAIGIQDIYSLGELAELLDSLAPELIVRVSQRVEENHRKRRLDSVTDAPTYGWTRRLP